MFEHACVYVAPINTSISMFVMSMSKQDTRCQLLYACECATRTLASSKRSVSCAPIYGSPLILSCKMSLSMDRTYAQPCRCSVSIVGHVRALQFSFLLRHVPNKRTFWRTFISRSFLLSCFNPYPWCSSFSAWPTQNQN